MTRSQKLWLAAMSLLIMGLTAATPQRAHGEMCLMVGSTCYSSTECCSNRCDVQDPVDPDGVCVP